MHTKAVIVDRQLVFVGSFNVNTRSTEIDTEMGLFLDSPVIAKRFAERVEDDLPLFTYRLVLKENDPDYGRIEWHYSGANGIAIEKTEPEAGFWRQFMAPPQAEPPGSRGSEWPGFPLGQRDSTAEPEPVPQA